MLIIQRPVDLPRLDGIADCPRRPTKAEGAGERVAGRVHNMTKEIAERKSQAKHEVLFGRQHIYVSGFPERVGIFLVEAGPFYGCRHQASRSCFAIQSPDRLQSHAGAKAVTGEGKTGRLRQFAVAEAASFCPVRFAVGFSTG